MSESAEESFNETFVVPDTSVFLHCRFFPDVAWADVVDRENVTLLVLKPVLQELDKHKDHHPSRKLRERARRVVEEMKNAQKELKGGIRQGVAFRFYRAALRPADFDPFSLDPAVPDERIVATFLRFQRENPTSEMILVARDAAMQFTASDLGVTVVEPPESISLDDEPDEMERELARLRRRNVDLESRSPVLSLVFASGENVLRPSPEGKPLGEDAFAQHRTELLADCPPVSQLRSLAVDATEWERYSRERAEYVEDVDAFLLIKKQWADRESRRLALDLVLRNVGRVPATDVSVEMTFPPGAIVETEYTMPHLPKAPDVPHAPRNRMGLFFLGTERTRFEASFDPSEEELHQQSLRMLPRPWEPEIETTSNGVVFREHFKKIQQASDEKVEKLWVVLPNVVTSFGIPFIVRADHMEPLNGTLHVVAAIVAE